MNTDMDTQGEGHVKKEAEMEWCVHKPGNTWNPKKLEEAGRRLP